MPRYDFDCQACHATFEVQASFSEYAALMKRACMLTQFATSMHLRCKRRGHLPFRRQEPAGCVYDKTRPAPLRLSRLGGGMAVAGFVPLALRGLDFQSPDTIYQSDPFCPRSASIAPPHLNALASVFRARKTVAPNTPNPQTVAAM
jgi:hypothetical protein